MSIRTVTERRDNTSTPRRANAMLVAIVGIVLPDPGECSCRCYVGTCRSAAVVARRAGDERRRLQPAQGSLHRRRSLERVGRVDLAGSRCDEGNRPARPSGAHGRHVTGRRGQRPHPRRDGQDGPDHDPRRLVPRCPARLDDCVPPLRGPTRLAPPGDQGAPQDGSQGGRERRSRPLAGRLQGHDLQSLHRRQRQSRHRRVQSLAAAADGRLQRHGEPQAADPHGRPADDRDLRRRVVRRLPGQGRHGGDRRLLALLPRRVPALLIEVGSRLPDRSLRQRRERRREGRSPSTPGPTCRTTG